MTPREAQRVGERRGDEEVASLATLRAQMGSRSRRWTLNNVPFLAGTGVGRFVCDTGADVTCITHSFMERAGLLGSVRPHPADGKLRRLRLPNGEMVESTGMADVDITVQLMLDVSDEAEAPVYVHWDRRITIQGVWVVPFDSGSPMDMYVSFADWGFGNGFGAVGPLGDLAAMVMHGARLAATPRTPRADGDVTYVVMQSGGSDEAPTVATVVSDEGGVAEKHPEDMTDDELRAALMERVQEDKRGLPFARVLVDRLVERRRIFHRLVPSEATVMVDMTVVGTPKPVSFKVPVKRGAMGDAATDGLLKWVAMGVAERVPWDTKSYGFAIIVPKAGGKWRVTINPTETNRVTERVEIEGGFMADSMVQEAQRAGRGCKYAAGLDFADAFLGLRLTERASEISTFTTPIGKLRWRNGYFGWHSFPAEFQRAMMERVILPSMDAVSAATLLAWIDDVLCGADSEDDFLAALLSVIDKALLLGWRLSLPKMRLLYDVLDWCGIEVDVKNSQWRVARHRVASLLDTPIPQNRSALVSVLGILRYYYFGVRNQMAQRERLATLLALDKPGVSLPGDWTEEHTTAFHDALREIVDGDWILVFDPSQKVYVWTDAAGKLGYAVYAAQLDRRTGTMRPIAYFSAGWVGPQLLGWTPQVKECYSKRQAVCYVMPKTFPFAWVTLLNDNKNLSAATESADARVVRWKHDIQCSGAHMQSWVPGDWNSIADYGSRSVVPRPNETLNADEQFELHLYAMVEDGGLVGGKEGVGAEALLPTGLTDDAPAGGTLVPGHLAMAPLVAKITAAQRMAPEEEQSQWVGDHYSTATLGDAVLHLWKDRLIVPRGQRELKTALITMAHDGGLHYTGASRTQWALENQARVHWKGLADDVMTFVRSCFKCAMAKAPHTKSGDVGTLQPTIAPYVHHTWYADIKGPMPYDTGYILVVVEAISRHVRLRYLPAVTAKEVIEEFEEVIISNGTRPVVLRSDGGQPFDSAEYRRWCAGEGITPVLGVSYHSQGQGLVETKIREIAAAIMATLGAKAERDWLKGPLLAKLEGIINTVVVEETVKGSPHWVLHGREPRTPLSAMTDWSAPEWGERVLGVKGATLNDVNEIVAQHHETIRCVQEMVQLGTSVAQALRARRRAGTIVTYSEGSYVIVRVVPVNRMRSWYTGPYRVTRQSPCGNFVWGAAFVDPLQVEAGPFHVSRLRLIDMTRATLNEVASHQLESGSAMVDDVLGHRLLADTSYEFHIKWYGTQVASTWVPSSAVTRVTKVIEYCRAQGLKAPGTEIVRPAAGGGRGRPRGGLGRGGAARGGRGGRNA